MTDRIDFHIYFHGSDDREVKHRLRSLIHHVKHWRDKTMALIDDLEAAATDETTVDDSVIALVNKLADIVEAAGTDPARLSAVIATMRGNKDRVAAAVIANTPADPAA